MEIIEKTVQASFVVCVAKPDPKVVKNFVI
jgi:hypothetical protein